jgi:hypothetical protein
VSFSDTNASKMLEFLEIDEKDEKEEIEIELKKTTDELTEIDMKLDRLLEAYLDTLVEGENYKQKKNELVEKQIVTREKINRLKEGNTIWIERMKEFIQIALECTKVARAEKNCHELKLMAKKLARNTF